MSIVVEHEKRRYEILEKALDVFMDEGYDNVTLQKIADRCGIIRTTLYTYFRNKRDIFNFSVKQFLASVESNINEIKKTKSLSCTERLVRVMNIIIECLEENRRLISVIMNYLVRCAKSDYEADYRVRRRTIRLRHIMATMIIDGIKAGEFTSQLNVKDATELLYSLLEAAIYRLAVLRRSLVGEFKDAAKLAIQGFVR